MKNIKTTFDGFVNESQDNELLNFAKDNLKDTIFKFDPKEGTKWGKKGFLRFRSEGDGIVLYVSKNRIVLIPTGPFNFSVSKEHSESYKKGNSEDFIKKLESAYNYCRFFTEHYPEPGSKYSIKDGKKL
jgi:hypothetical protein